MSFYILALNKFMSILNTSQAFFAWVMMQKAHTKKQKKKLPYCSVFCEIVNQIFFGESFLFYFIQWQLKVFTVAREGCWKCLHEFHFAPTCFFSMSYFSCPPPPPPLAPPHHPPAISVCELPTRISTGSCTKPSSASPAPRRSALGLWTSVGPCHRCLINPRRRKVENHWCEGQNWTEEVASTPRSARRKPPTL